MNKPVQKYSSRGFPVGHVIGFLMSLLLTFAAAIIALKTSLPVHTIMFLIGGLAIIQAGLQLFMFMHVSEGEDKKTQLANIVYGVFVAVVIVAGSIWVLTSGHAAH